MFKLKYLKSVALGGVSAIVLATTAYATEFNIPGGDLKSALDAYAAQARVSLIVSGGAIKDVRTRGARGELTADAALSHILTGTGFVSYRNAQGEIGIMRGEAARRTEQAVTEIAQATPRAFAAASGIEAVIVTSSKIKGDIQTVPIAITALSQEQLTARQIAGGPDLVKEVPNLTFSKTNFTGYNIQIRGIGTQAISVTTDPAVAVAFNDTPFIRNHFFEQEFYDVGQVEVLRGPQGTLYGRNATAGVVNLTSAKPTDQFEGMASVDISNFSGRRIEGMINLPIVDDRLDIRIAGEMTKRDGYSFNSITGKPIDGRNLWSTRVTVGLRPFEGVQTYLVWEHFQENDDRMRSAKQLCHGDPGPSSLGGVSNIDQFGRGMLSQGCLPASLYAPESFETPNGSSLPIVLALQAYSSGAASNGAALEPIDPYASATQSRDLRVIESALTPTYDVNNDVLEFNADFTITPELTLTSQSAYGHDQLGSTEDFNRFTTAPGIFPTGSEVIGHSALFAAPATPGGVYCDPQLGCSDRLVGADLSQEHAWQGSQELRLTSSFGGPFNFSLGGNFLHYETVEDYFVFVNLLTMIAQAENQVGYANEPASDFIHCFGGGRLIPHTFRDPRNLGINAGCVYIDPNPISHLDGNGHNYFRSENPYVVNSYAGFGEAYYQVTPELKLTGGLRWTDDKKHFVDLPSWVAATGWGYPQTDIVNQQWKKFTGRFVANWSPKFDFTDQSMFYASYSRGYKGGGANPPGPVVTFFSSASALSHPLTFGPEFNNAYEIGAKNTFADGSVTLNGDAFYYDYKGYQISEIVDRTSINLNVDAKVKGAEFEGTWEPAPGLRFNFAGGYENSRIDDGQSSIDLIDRTAGHDDWMIVKPFVSATSNCVLPKTIVEQILLGERLNNGGDASHPPSIDGFVGGDAAGLQVVCLLAYGLGLDPGTIAGVTTGYDPSTAPNGGAGFTKPLGGNELPNTPHFTLSMGAQYTIPFRDDWAATLRGDFYYQSDSWARIFNDSPYDRIHGYKNVNLALILTGESGWQAMAYMKNVFDTTAITGAFLNSDDTGLTTNVFVTDPRLFGVRVTKNW